MDASGWHADVVLTDGGTVHLRPITPQDGERLRDLHGRLSPESIYLRFFSPKPRLTDKEVERFTTVDHVDRMALVATLGDDIIAVGRYDRWPGKDEAEVAFTVDDAHQGRGLATVLLEHLAVLAKAHGITRFTAEVLPDNRPMLAVFRRAGFDVKNAFDQGIVDVVLELDATPSMVEKVEVREQRAESRSIARLLAARSVAVVGASTQTGSVGHALFRNLLERGVDATVYPVNPTAPHVAGVRAYPTVGDIPDDVHLAVIAVPADEVMAVAHACVDKRVRGLVVVSEGFDDGEELVRLARANGVRVIGPSSMGLIRTGASATLHASFAPAHTTLGPLAISSQSGPLGAAMLENAARLGLGVSTFVSLGEKLDVSANDFLQFWFDDPDTGVVLMYTESFGNPGKFGRVARRVSRRKPIVAVKSRSAGQSDTAVDALFGQAGVIRVDTVEELFDVGRVLATQPLGAGTRLAVVTNARSPAVLAADAWGQPLAELTSDTRRELAARLHRRAAVDNPVDLTHAAEAADVRAALELVLADPGVDAVLVVDAPPVVAGRERAEAVEAVAGAAAAAGTGKPIVAVTLGQPDGPLLPGGSVPSFTFPERAARALRAALGYGVWRARPEGTPIVLEAGATERVREAVAYALERRPSGTLLPLVVVAEVLAAAGVPFARSAAVTTVDAAVEAASSIGFPVALKAAGLARMARSESGGVALDLQSPDEVAAAYGRMRSALGSGMAEAIVQHMVPGGVEAFVSLELDPVFGPVVATGLGGAFVDAIADHAVRAVPLTVDDAAALVTESRASTAIALFGASAAPLVDIVARIGALVDEVPEIDRLRLNPVLVSAGAAWAVDASIHVAPLPERADLPVRRL